MFYEFRNSEFGIQNSEFGIQNSEFRIRNSEFGSSMEMKIEPIGPS